MAFPASPNDGDLHTEFTKSFQWSAAQGAWLTYPSSGASIDGADVTFSPTGTIAATTVTGAIVEQLNEMSVLRVTSLPTANSSVRSQLRVLEASGQPDRLFYCALLGDGSTLDWIQV